MARKKNTVSSPGKAGIGHKVKKGKGRLGKDSSGQKSIVTLLANQGRQGRNRKPLGEIVNVEMTNDTKEDIVKNEDNFSDIVKKEEKDNVEKKDGESENVDDSEMAGLCEYEKIRLKNIRQREALFAELAIKEAKEQASGGHKKESVKREKRNRDSLEDKDSAEPEPVRKSLRLAGGKVPEIKRFSYEEFEILDEELRSRKIRPEDFYLDDELVSRNVAVEEREKMLAEMAEKARTFSGKTERPSGLKEIPKDRFKILHVPKKCTIKQFVLSNSLVFKCGRGFYEFTKPEIISHKKEVVVVEKSTGAMFSGKDACRLIGAGGGQRIPPTIFDTWQVFVQSTSFGRNLVGGTDFLYEV